ncbi:hypothetical protein B2K_39245 [Paenibacillus mucilaginosus K02]|uniref:Uncharacterized protein n=1 Tax=Paenibacillus mucilaginosus K02 TaxID=997761 RepID=R9UN33_9BACL|nr:hypothetical protein B2K_39245 [Paenibacillus mucilaginosus K02]
MQIFLVNLTRPPYIDRDRYIKEEFIETEQEERAFI